MITRKHLDTAGKLGEHLQQHEHNPYKSEVDQIPGWKGVGFSVGDIVILVTGRSWMLDFRGSMAAKLSSYILGKQDSFVRLCTL